MQFANAFGWWKNAGDAHFYCRDYVNSRNHLWLTPAATSNAANTTFQSTLTTDAQTITGSADVVQLAVKANVTQTHDLQEWQSSSGASLASINYAGALVAPASQSRK